MVWMSAGLPTPPFSMLDANSNWSEVAEALGMPIFVKPAREGSSVGATKVTSADQLEAAYHLAAKTRCIGDCRGLH